MSSSVSQEKTSVMLKYFLGRGHETIEHAFFASLFEVDGELVTIDRSDAAVAEFLVENEEDNTCSPSALKCIAGGVASIWVMCSTMARYPRASATA